MYEFLLTRLYLGPYFQRLWSLFGRFLRNCGPFLVPFRDFFLQGPKLSTLLTPLCEEHPFYYPWRWEKNRETFYPNAPNAVGGRGRTKASVCLCVYVCSGDNFGPWRKTSLKGTKKGPQFFKKGTKKGPQFFKKGTKKGTEELKMDT